MPANNPKPPESDPAAPEQIVELLPGQVSLVKLCAERLTRLWQAAEAELAIKCAEAPPQRWPGHPDGDLATAVFDNAFYLRRRMPNEIEQVLATLAQGELELVKSKFADCTLNMQEFAAAIVHCGTYDSDRVLAFVGGVVDLFLEVLWSHPDFAQGAPPSTVRLGQLMNHFIEGPELCMFEGKELNAGPKALAAGTSLPQVNKSSIIDAAKHLGHIEKMCWLPYLEWIATVEGAESVMLWNPLEQRTLDQPKETGKNEKQLKPEFPKEIRSLYYTDKGQPIFKVLAASWDQESQEITALLSNRTLVGWRLRNREKGQFQEKARILEIHATRGEYPAGFAAFSAGNTTQTSSSTSKKSEEDEWKIYLRVVGGEGAGVNNSPSAPPSPEANRAISKDLEERLLKREKREERMAREVAEQLDIWWSANMRYWVTADRRGRVFMWDLRAADTALTATSWPPARELNEHTETVTSFLELSRYKFTTISLDRTVLLWDNRNVAAPEMKILEHSGSVLSQAYLPAFTSLVTAGCEKRVFVWSIDSTAYRGVRAKLTGHQANLSQVSAGQRVFFTLDQASVMILWDGATLVCLQTVNASVSRPRHVLAMPSLGRVCLAGRRLNYYEGNEQAATAIGAMPSEEQRQRTLKQEMEGVSLKERALPKWCGLSATRGTMLSVTEQEVRVHARHSPAHSRAVFNAPENDSIQTFSLVHGDTMALLGTQKGSLFFLKYRSGYARKVYTGRRDDGNEWKPDSGSAEKGADGQEAAGAGGKDVTSRPQTRGGSRPATVAATEASSVGNRAMSPAAGSRGGQAAAEHGVPSGRSSPVVGSRRSPAGDSGGDPGTLSVGTDFEEDDDRPQAAAEARPSRPKVAANAPSQDEINRGLTSSIMCILPCEELQRAFVGTAEGQVLVIALDQPGFPVVRWLNHEDSTAVTALEYAADGAGLLCVGVQDGVVHLYSLSTLRLAGSINVPRHLPDKDAVHGVAVRHIKLLRTPTSHDPAVEPDRTFLTIDERSRIRMWHVRIHQYSGQLISSRLVIDGGRLQPREEDGTLTSIALEIKAKAAKAKADAAAKAKAKAKADAKKKDKVAEDADAKEGQEDAQEGEGDGDGESKAKKKMIRLLDPVSLDDPQRPVRITGVASVRGRVVTPTFERILARKKAFRAQAEAAFTKAEEARKAAERGEKPRDDPSSARPLGGGDGSDTEGDDLQVLAHRAKLRPKLPRFPEEWNPEEVVETHEEETDAHGGNLLFLSDQRGCIWCIDMAATAAAATEAGAGMNLAVENKWGPTAVSLALPRGSNRVVGSRGSVGTAFSGLMGGSSHTRDEVARAPCPKPELVSVVGSWLAHNEVFMDDEVMVQRSVPILSMVAVNQPAALVTSDSKKTVKVWSLMGECWGHFSLLGLDGVLPEVKVWPPPHVLSAQLALMDIAKSLTHRLGLHSEKEKKRQSAQQQRPRHMSKKRGTLVDSQGKMNFSASAPSLSGITQRVISANSLRRQPTAAADPDFEESGSLLRELTPVPAMPGNESQLKKKTFLERFNSADKKASADGGATAGAAAAGAAAKAEGGGDDEASVPASPAAGGSETAEDGGGGFFQNVDEGPKKLFTNRQMSEMIKNRAFSAGFKNWSQFNRRDPASSAPSWRSRIEATQQMDQERESFFVDRTPIKFGLKLTETEKRMWSTSANSMGPRSSSEGTLVRYALDAVQATTRSVHENLRVDVSQISLHQLQRPSFAAGLDIGNVSYDPSDPTSATAQAIGKLLDESNSKRKSKETPTSANGSGQRPRGKSLQSAGAMSLGGSRRR